MSRGIDISKPSLSGLCGGGGAGRSAQQRGARRARRMGVMMQALGAAILALCLSAPFAGAGQAELQALMAEIEGKVGELADAVELWQGRRCQLDVVGQEACQDKNYHACEPPASSPSAARQPSVRSRAGSASRHERKVEPSYHGAASLPTGLMTFCPV